MHAIQTIQCLRPTTSYSTTTQSGLDNLVSLPSLKSTRRSCSTTCEPGRMARKRMPTDAQLFGASGLCDNAGTSAPSEVEPRAKPDSPDPDIVLERDQARHLRILLR